MFWRGIEKVPVLKVAWTVHGEKSGFIASYLVVFRPQREVMVVIQRKTNITRCPGELGEFLGIDAVTWLASPSSARCDVMICTKGTCV